MKKTLKKYFIPHADNNYHPHVLHTKRVVLYAAVLVALKVIVFVFVLFLPSAVFVLPDILAGQQARIVVLTNELRAQKGLPELIWVDKLNTSSYLKASDMVGKNYFSHTSPEGHKFAYFLQQAGYKYDTAGENLALGFSDSEEVVNAWIKSPTHFANLIDGDFKEIGVDLESGEYDGQPTVYLAQHFGSPNKENIVVENKKVAGIEISKPAEIIFNYRDSKVYWEEKNKATIFTVEANIDGPVASATVDISGYPIELETDGNGSFFGSLNVSEPAENFFKIIISPTITIIDDNNAVIKGNIDWDRVKIVSPTPVQKYIYARDWMSKIFPIFSVSKSIYLFFLILIGIILAINILVEIRIQHHRVIIQTLALIGLISCLYVI